MAKTSQKQNPKDHYTNLEAPTCLPATTSSTELVRSSFRLQPPRTSDPRVSYCASHTSIARHLVNNIRKSIHLATMPRNGNFGRRAATENNNPPGYVRDPSALDAVL
jgi:hypothetical protein